jgi:hypothetical protein
MVQTMSNLFKLAASIRMLLPFSFVAFVGCGPAEEGESRAPDDVQLGSDASGLLVNGDYSWAAAKRYVGEGYGYPLEQCCSNCNVAWVSHEQHWDQSLSDYREWQQSRRAIGFALARLGSEVVVIALGGTARLQNVSVQLALAAILLRDAPELAGRTSRLRLAIAATVGAATATLQAMVDGDESAFSQLVAMNGALQGVIDEARDLALEVVSRLGHNGERVANILESVITVVDGVLEGIEKIDAAIADIEPLVEEAGAARGQLDIHAQQYFRARGELAACCASRCGCLPMAAPQACGVGQTCGSAPDGCDGWVDCGTCTDPETCGGGGVQNQCGCAVGTGACRCPVGLTWDPIDGQCATCSGLGMSPTSGAPGAEVFVSGGGYLTGEVVTIYFDGEQVGGSNQPGSPYTDHYFVPSTESGVFRVEALGSSSGTRRCALFSVP